MYDQVEESLPELEWLGVIGNIERNRRLNNESTFPPVVEQSNVSWSTTFPPIIKVAIQEGKVHTATDASMKDGEMGGSWILTNNNKDEIIQNVLYHKN